MVPVVCPGAAWFGSRVVAVHRRGREPIPIATLGEPDELEGVGVHLENLPKQAPHLRVRSPIRDRLQIGWKETDQMVMLRRVPPDLPPCEPACGKASQKRVGHGRMGGDLLSELLDKFARRHGCGTR